MKTPEEYFQEQVFSADHDPSGLTETERSFLKKYLGVEPTSKDTLGEALPRESQVESVMAPNQKPLAVHSAPSEPSPSPSTEAPKSEPAPQSAPAPAPQSPAQEESMTARLKRDAELQLVSFFLNDQEYALPISSIQEVIKFVEPTKLPTAPPYMIGIINLRGRVTPLISLTSLLRLPETREGRFIVVCRHQGLQIGLIIHAVATMYRVGQESVEWNIETHLGVNADFLSGLIKSQERLIGIVAIDQLVKAVLR
ncbi:MAG: purine-binding chemotaxis protein CheW [Deltaproteobacteria bacterium]|nr:purine-binding chemotaxis protein CheW [Deltaproteobacteria bacterium]